MTQSNARLGVANLTAPGRSECLEVAICGGGRIYAFIFEGRVLQSRSPYLNLFPRQWRPADIVTTMKHETRLPPRGLAQRLNSKAEATIAKHDSDREIVSEKTAEEGGKLRDKTYLKELAKLHVELVKLQEWAKATGAKICICFEGRDGAGKGGVIKAITERVSPRTFRVVALSAPTDREKSQMYIQRYVPHLPAAGEIVIFDRSWYNRAGVERVLGFCTKKQVKEFLRAAPLVEKAIVASGVILVKYWLEVGPKEQTKRLRGRVHDGRKIWKLSPMDIASYNHWDDYTDARDDMFDHTDTAWAPWYVADSNDKKRARLNIIKHFLDLIPYEEVPRPKVKFPTRKVRRGAHGVGKSRQMVPQSY